MPFTTRDGTRLYWRLEGPTERPALMLLNAIGTDMALWDPLVPLLLPHFQILRFDARGHGASDAPPGDYSFEMLAHDVIAVMDAASLPRAAIAGVSLGGMIAMETALRFPEHVAALVLICTSASIDRALWTERVRSVRARGVVSVADGAMTRFLSQQFSAAHPDRAAAVRRTLLSTQGYAGAAAAIRDGELQGKLASINAPTLIVSGNQDISMPFAPHSEALLAAIGGSVSERIDAGHLAPLEAPHALAQAIDKFFSAGDEAHRAAQILYEAGLVNRRRVLGDTWVDRSLANRTSLDADFQEMITRIAWHEVWGRPGLDERTRRLLVLAVTASLGRWEEFSLHTRAGLTHGGFSRDELKEVLMQLAIYAGVPAANTAFAHARQIIAELDGSGDAP
jgi:3-oxoadipate enol-lactonase / 4-carboxymuconolactone decarboxylase